MYQPLPRVIPALDGLRGLAALVVLVSHCANAGYLPVLLGDGAGQMGVAIFFALSGFLMAHVCFAKRCDTHNLLTYLQSRSARVLPLFYLVLLVAGLSLILTGTPLYRITGADDFVANLLMLRGSGVLWSVAVECQFYILFVALWMAQRRGQLVPVMLLMGIPALLFAYRFGEGLEQTIYLPLWLHFFLMGVLLRWVMDDGLRNRIPARVPAATTAVMGWLVLLAVPLLPPGVRIAMGFADYANYLDPVVIGAIPFLIWSCCAQAGPIALLGTAPLRWLGSISFGVYLIHSPLIVLLHETGLDRALPPFVSFAAVLALTLGLAWFSQVAFETPVRRMLNARPSARIVGRYVPSAA